MGPRGDFRPSGIDLGVSEEWILVLFRCSFVQVGRLARRRAEPHFDSVWASRIEVRRLRAQVKIRWKNSSENASSASRATARLRKVVFSNKGTSKWYLRALRKVSWAALGRCWGLLGRSWALLGSSWGALGNILGALRVLLGGSWTLLKASGRFLDPPGRFEVAFGPSEDRF